MALDIHGLSLKLLDVSYHKRKNVNVSVYSLKSPLSSADFTIYVPGIGTLSYTVSSPLRRIQHIQQHIHIQFECRLILLLHTFRYHTAASTYTIICQHHFVLAPFPTNIAFSFAQKYKALCCVSVCSIK